LINYTEIPLAEYRGNHKPEGSGFWAFIANTIRQCWRTPPFQPFNLSTTHPILCHWYNYL